MATLQRLLDMAEESGTVSGPGTDTSPAFLTGFATDTDDFVGPLPPLRSCHLCGVVPKSTFVLECSHAFCKLCYEQIVHKGQGCPLDQERFEEGDVSSLVFKTKQLLKLSTRCHNWSGSCEFVGNVRETVDHLVKDLHVVRCGVVRDSILDHYARFGDDSDKIRPRSVDRKHRRSKRRHPAEPGGHESKAVFAPGRRQLAQSRRSKDDARVESADENSSLKTRDGRLATTMKTKLSSICPPSDSNADVALLDIFEVSYSHVDDRRLLRFYLVIRRSSSDDHLPWPFGRKHVVAIKHPEARDTRKELLIRERIENHLKHHGRSRKVSSQLGGYCPCARLGIIGFCP